MTLLDWIILAYVFGTTLNGLKAGLVRMIGSIVGVVLGVALAAQWYDTVGTWLAQFVFANPLLAKVMAFVLIVMIVTRLVSIVAAMIDRVVKFASIFPPIAAANRLGGLALGFLEGTLVVAAALFFAAKFPINPQWKSVLEKSTLAPMVLGLGNYITPLLPSALKQLQSVLKYV